MRKGFERTSQSRTRLGQAHGPAFEFDQTYAVMPLQIRHLLRDRRLREVELTGGMGVVEMPANSQKRMNPEVKHGAPRIRINH